MVIDSILVRELEDARGKFRKLKAEFTELETQAGKGGKTGSGTGDLEKQLAGSQAQLEQVRQQLETVLKERELLAREVSEAKTALQTSHKESEKTKSGKESALENANRELVEIRTQLGALGLERGQVASELEQAKKAAKSERDEFLKEKKKLDAVAETAHRELAALREKTGIAESERKQIASELEDTRRALDASRDTFDNGRKTYAEALDKANKELTALRAQMGDTEASRDRLAAELSDLKKALAASRQLCDALRGEGEKAVAESKSLLESAEKKALKFEAECKTLHVNIEKGSAELHAKREQLHKTRNEQQVTLDANERMKRELKELREQLSGAQGERESRTGELVQLRTQLQEARRQSEIAAASQGRLQDELKAAHAGTSAIQEKLKELTGEQQKLSAKLEEHSKARLEIQTQLDASGRECAEIKLAAEQIRKERDHNSKELSHANASLARVQGQLDALKLNNNELKQAHEQVKKELMQARQHLSSWQGENDALAATLSNLETQLTSALKQIHLQRGKPLAAA
jgi:chromosome segregation ATPase